VGVIRPDHETLLHADLREADPGQLATAGNFAIPLTPHEQEAGPVFRFSLYHLMPLPDPADFPIEVFHVGVPASQKAAVDPNFAPKVDVVVARPPKAILNGHAAKITSETQHRLLLSHNRSDRACCFQSLISCDTWQR
jgi:hypothetical protein